MVNGENTAGLTDLWYLPAVTHFWSQTRQTMGKLSFASVTICAGASFCPFANIKRRKIICFPKLNCHFAM